MGRPQLGPYARGAGRRPLGWGRRRTVAVAPHFGGGLNAASDEAHLAPDELREAENVRLVEGGALVLRGATQRVTTTELSLTNAVRGGYSWRQTDGTVTELAVAGSFLYVGTYAIPMTFASVAAAVDATAPIAFAAFRRTATDEVCYLADGGPLNCWDGTTFSADLAGTPNVSVVWVYNSRLFGIGADDGLLYWSGLNDGHSLGVVASGGGSAVVRTFGDSRLVTGRAVGGSNLLFHESGISVFRGLTIDDINISAGTTGLTQDVGTRAPHALVDVEGGVLFVSDRGVHLATEGGVVPVAGPFERAIARFTQEDFAAMRAVHARAEGEVWFAVPSEGLYVYSYRVRRPDGRGAWVGPFRGMDSSPIHALWETVDAVHRPIVLKGDAAGWVTRCEAPGLWGWDNVASDGSTAAATAYEAYVIPARFDFGALGLEASLAAAYIGANFDDATPASSSLVVDWRTSDGSFPAYTVPTADLDVTTGTRGYHVPLHGRGQWVELEITATADAPIAFTGAEIEAHILARRR